jgi:hypothetical protein
MKMLRIISWMVAILLVVEFGLEIRADRRGYDTVLFGSAERGLPNAPRTEPIYGPTADFPFRSRIIGKARTLGVDRIWLASASYGEDTYVEPDLVFPSLAARELGEAGHPTEILNASRAGNSVGSNILFLNQHAAEWSPRAVILYQMSLDINLLSEQLLGNGDSGTPGLPDAGRTDVIPAEPRQKPQPNVLVRFYESSTIYKTLKELIGGRATQERILAQSLGPRGVPMFRQEIRDFVAAARALGIEPILCTFATSHDTGNLAQMPVASRNSVFRYNIYLAMTGWVATIDQFNGVIAEVAASESLQLIDVGGALGGHPEYFRDYIHFNPKGHAAVATLLVAALVAEAEGGK